MIRKNTMSRISVAALVFLLLSASIGNVNVFAQETSSKTSEYVRPSLPEGFMPKYADRQAYTSQKIQRLVQNPEYFKDKPDKIAEVFAYLEFMIDGITRPNNHQIGAEQRQRYLDMRDNLRAKIGIDANASPSVAIAVLYTVSKMSPETFKLGAGTDDIPAILKKQGFTNAESSDLIHVFNAAGFDARNVFTVGDAIQEVADIAGLDGGVADSIVDALGLEASTSFSDAVSAYNSAYGTSLSVEQAREALGLEADSDVGNAN